MTASALEQALTLLDESEYSVPADEMAELVARARQELHELRTVAVLGAHPIRAGIVTLMDADRARRWSPNGLAIALGERLGTVAYHVRTLHAAGALEAAGQRRRRGAVEHFYRRPAAAPATGQGATA